jgi:hypothetical protein
MLDFNNNLKKKGDSKANIIFFISGLFFILIFCYIIYADFTRISFGDDGCPNEGPHGTVAVIFDNTDNNSEINKFDIQRSLNEIKNSIKKYQNLSIYVITNEYENISPKISICNPGSLEDAGKYAFINNNTKTIIKDWEEKFSSKIDILIEDLANGGVSDYSHIFEMIKNATIISLKYVPDEYKSDNKLIVFSDFMQNSSEFSHYNNNIDFASFKKNYSSYFDNIYVDLRGAAVEMYMIPRAKLQTDYLAEFWKEYFLTIGSRRLPKISKVGS